MADNSYKINKSINLNPQSGAPANPVDGDIYYDSTVQSFAYYHNGSWANLDSVGVVSGVDPMTSAQFTPAIVRNSVIKVTGHSSPIHIEGITASFAGKRIMIYNGGTDIITIEYDDSGEPTSNNRIFTPTGGDMNIVVGEVATLTYDIIANRWLLVSISSQGGAQVIATTGHPGLVQLHQASLTPADGIVLSDGDLNTATGVVGLDSNRAATIAAPLSSVTALTITAAASAAALDLHYTSGTVPVLKLPSVTTNTALSQNSAGGDTVQFTLNDSVMQLGQRKLKFSDNDGFSNHYDNYMQYSYLGGLSHRGVQFVNQTSSGTATFTINSQTNGGGQARVDLIFNDSSSNQDQITFDQGTLYLGFSSGAVKVMTNTGRDFTINSASTDLWKFTSAGVLSAVGGNRAIQSVLDPVSAQDAATKNYVDNSASPPYARNLIINGGMDFWQRGTSIAVVTELAIAYTADRWGSQKVSGGAFTVTQQTDVPSVNLFKYSLKWQRTASNSDTNVAWLTQEIDRDMLRIYGDNTNVPFTLGFWAKKGANFSGSLTVQLHTGDGSEGDAWMDAGYADDTTPISSTVSLSTSWQWFSFTCSNLGNTGAGRTSQAALTFIHHPSGTAGANDWYEITGVMLAPKAALSSDYFALAGGNIASELALCLRYYEKTYDIDVAPGASTTDSQFQFFATADVTTAGSKWPMSSQPTFRVTKWTPPTKVSFWDISGNAGVWDINGLPNTPMTFVQATKVGFYAANGDSGSHTPSTTTVSGGHWAADSEFY